MICPICNSEIQTGARFCSACGQRITPAYIPVQDAAAQAGLVRPREGRMIAGVCRGFAQRYGWDVAIVRLVLVLAVFLGCGTPFLGYIVAWIVMPNGPFFVPAAYTAQPVASQPEQGTQPQA
jgi:phage shock protein C